MEEDAHAYSNVGTRVARGCPKKKKKIHWGPTISNSILTVQAKSIISSSSTKKKMSYPKKRVIPVTYYVRMVKKSPLQLM